MASRRPSLYAPRRSEPPQPYTPEQMSRKEPTEGFSSSSSSFSISAADASPMKFSDKITVKKLSSTPVKIATSPRPRTEAAEPSTGSHQYQNEDFADA